MKIVTGETGSGKTTFLIKESSKTGATIVARSSMIKIIMATAKTLNLAIPIPLSYYDIVEHKYHGKNIKSFLIDDVEDFLSHMMTIPVETVSTRDVEVVEVHRSDWNEPKKEFKGTTTDRNDPSLNVILLDGMQQKYLVLSEEERKKGFVRPYRDEYKHLKCGTTTRMGRALSETYARNPKFYGATYCVHCGTHFPLHDYNDADPPVWEHKFIWTADGTPVGD